MGDKCFYVSALCLSLFFSETAEARFATRPTLNTKCPDIVNAGFSHPRSPDWHELGVPIQAVGSSLKISTKEDGTCSSNRVSKHGHIITAMHCLESCLEKAGALVSQRQVVLEDGKKFDVPYLAKSGSPSGWKTCRIDVEGVGPVDFQIVAMGDCSPESVRVGLKNIGKSISLATRAKATTQTCKTENDFVVLQSPKLSGTENDCLPMAKSRATLGQKIFSTGFPTVTGRWERDSDGSSFHADAGTVVKQNYCDQISSANRRPPLPKKPLGQLPTFEELRKSIDEIPPAGVESVKQIDFNPLFQMTIGKEDLLQVTADGVPGNSGGGLISQNGEYLGLASTIYDGDNMSNTSYQCRGSVFYIPTDTIVQKIDDHSMSRKELSSKHVFDCR